MFRVKNNIPIDLWNNKSPITLTPYCLEDGDIFAAMLILPGGGYGICSNQEGEPVAGWLNSLGISAFVLNYSVPPKYKEEPYFDARRAMQFIRPCN